MDGEEALAPDYDYRAWIDSSASPRWTSGAATPSGKDFFVDDPSSLLQRRHFGDGANVAAGKSATLHVPLADLKIDSDQNGVFGANDNWVELDRENGRVIEVISGDMDSDGVVDFFDFDGIAGASFEPIRLSLSSNLAAAASASEITVTFDYSFAGGSATESNGAFRIWTKDASEDRSATSTLIEPGVSYQAVSLGLQPGNEITLFLEAVQPSRRTRYFDSIEVDIAVNGSWSGNLVDVVHAKGVRNEAPEFEQDQFDASIQAGSESVYAVGTYVATDPEGDPVAYRLEDTFGGLFSVDETGKVTMKTSEFTPVDQDAYALRLIAEDNKGNEATADIDLDLFSTVFFSGDSFASETGIDTIEITVHRMSFNMDHPLEVTFEVDASTRTTPLTADDFEDPKGLFGESPGVNIPANESRVTLTLDPLSNADNHGEDWNGREDLDLSFVEKTSTVPFGSYKQVTEEMTTPGFPQGHFASVNRHLKVVEGIQLFVKGDGDATDVHYNDVKQGNTGNCWCLAGLAAAAFRKPSSLKSAITLSEDEAVVIVTLAGGKTLEYPFEAEGNISTAFFGDVDGDKNQETWMLFAERAVRDHRDSLGVGGFLFGGQPSLVWEYFFGTASTTFVTDSNDATDEYPHLTDQDFADTIVSAFGAGKLLAVGSKNTAPSWIVSNHAYVITTVNGS
ncbi:MAG: hypothetical protein AAGD07_25335, partial [Planctomycetota bacterium]